MKKIFLGVFLLFAAVSVQAQKFGYVNSQELLANLPEVKAADKELENFQKALVTKGQQMVGEFEVEYKKFMEEVNAGTLSKVQSQARETDLQKKQEEIQKYEVEVQEKLAAKRESLFKPILDKVKMTITAYGKENGYTMIFDTSAGSLLHAEESDNLLQAIKAKL